MKRLLFWLLVSLLSSAQIMAQEIVTVDGIQYIVDVDNNRSYVLGPENNSISSAVIHETITYQGDEYSVVALLNNCFSDCRDLISVDIPSSITQIGENCFQDCYSIQSISIPSSVNTLPKNCFASCTLLSNVIIPSSVEIIEEGCFINCTSLSNINLPSNLKSLGNSCFERCTSLINLSIPEDVTSIGIGCFSGCSKLETVNIPNSITTIEAYCFTGYKLLSTIEFPPFLKEVGDNAFSSCESLSSVVFPNTIEKIGEQSFGYCTSLKKVEIPESVTQMGVFSFIKCTSMTEATIHTSAELPGTFGWCNKLFKVTCDASSIPYISTYCSPRTFDGTQYDTIGYLYVPSSMVDSYKADGYWGQWSNIAAINASGGESTNKCATPTISYTNGRLLFNCATEGATCQYSITDTDIKSGSGNEVQLTVTYNVSVYATKSGMEDSDVATATLCWIDKQPTINTSNNAIELSATPVLIQSNGGVLTIQGVDDGTPISVYTSAGIQAGSAISHNGHATISTNLQNGSIAIVKIGSKSVKVVIK